MDVRTLRTVLEHLPDDLPVFIAGRGEIRQVRRPEAQRWVTPGVYLDDRGEGMLRGRFIDMRTLRVRLEALGEAS